MNAFFVAAEFALVKARDSRIEGLAISGKFGAAMTLKIQKKLESYLAACQLGITMASLGLGWVGEPFVSSLLEPVLHSFGFSEEAIHTIAFLVGFLIFSSLHIVVGEQVPKTFAIRKAEQVSMWAAYPLQVFYLALYPLTTSLDFLSRKFLSLFGVEEASHADIYNSQELQNIVSQSTEHGELTKNKGKMLNNLFNFDQLRVGRVMMPFSQVRCLDVQSNAEENIRVLRTTGHSRFPLIDSKNNNELLGLILAKDLYNASLIKNNNPWENLRDFARNTLVVTEHQNVAGLFENMRTKRSHLAIIVDEYGTPAGIVTIEDLLEEIVGEIEDETDSEKPLKNIRFIENGVWEVNGLTPLPDIEKKTGLVVDPSIDANTLSGYVMECLSRMPSPGDTITTGEYKITVTDTNNRRVEKAIIRLLAID